MADRIDNGAFDADGLDMFFKAARAVDPVPGGDLMARVLADAGAVQAELASAPVTASSGGAGFWAGLGAALGGWGAASALTASICLGVFVGLSAPDAVLSYVPGIETQSGDVSVAFLGYFDETDLAVGE